jgi:DNA modification methylase
MTVRIINADCLDALKGLPNASVHSCVTDPPYHLTTGKKD